MNAVTCYEILGLREDALPQQIRAAYIKLAREYHPDTLPPEMRGRQIARDAEETFKQVVEAYRILSDPQLRRTYDDQLRKMRAQASRNTPPPRTSSGTASGPTGGRQANSGTTGARPGSGSHPHAGAGAKSQTRPACNSRPPLTLESVCEKCFFVWFRTCLSGAAILAAWDLFNAFTDNGEIWDILVWFGKSTLPLCWPTPIPFLNIAICLLLVVLVIPTIVFAAMMEFAFLLAGLVVALVLAIVGWGIGLL